MSDNMDFKAFEEGGMDEFMRKTLEGHRIEPKPGLWKGISRTLLWRELTRFNFTNLSVKYRIAGTAGLMFLAAAIYYILPGAASTETSTREPVAGVKVSEPMSVVNIGGSSTHTVTRSAPDPLKVGHVSTQAPAPARPVLAKPVSAPKPQAYAYHFPRQSKQQHAAVDNLMAENMQPSPSGNTFVVSPFTEQEISPLVPVGTSFLVLNPQTDTIITISNPNGLFRVLKAKPTAAQFFSLNFGVTPEMSFYSNPEPYSKVNVWVDGRVSYHFSRFSLTTGAGLGYVYDQGKYKTEYKSKDSIGYFTSVISYTIGSNNEVIYNTVKKSVYDSLIHQNDYRTLNRYAYLQVPLLLGYRFYEGGRVSMTFQAGPAVSFLLGTRKSSAVIDYPNARIIRVDDNTPDRVTTNWQVWGDLLVEIRMNKKCSLYFEPSCKYYLNPMVEQENVTMKSPWSVGLGVGLQFNFTPQKSTP